MSDRFTVVFKGDIRAFDGNPLHIVSPFGEVAACGEGDAFEAADTIEALRAENARLREALKPLAALTKEILDEKGRPSGDFLFDTWTDDQAVFFLDTKRIITAGDIRTAYQLLSNPQRFDLES